MSKHLISKEEAINQLYNTIKRKFEEDGVLQEVRCLLQAKMVTMMRGKCEGNSLVQRPQRFEEKNIISNDPRIALLNQLIIEYFNWHGYQYSAEMFALESDIENVKPIRDCMEALLGTFEHKNLPILLELITELMQKQYDKNNNQNQNTSELQ